MSNASDPIGRASAAATCRTDAYDGPWLHHSTIASTAGSSPSTWHRPEPSVSLRTPPLTPSRSASCTAYHRKETPWTLPVTVTVTAFTTGSEDHVGAVRRSLRGARDQRPDAASHGPGLRPGRAGELDRVAGEGVDGGAVETEPKV